MAELLDRISELLERLPRHADPGGEIARYVGLARGAISQGIALRENTEKWLRQTLVQLEGLTRDTGWQEANR